MCLDSNVATANSLTTLSFSVLVRVQSCGTTSNLTYVLTGIEASITNVGLVVEKI